MNIPNATAARLAAERLRVVAQIEDLLRLYGEIVDASTAVATDDEHDPEGQTIAFERAQAGAMLETARRRLADLDQAADRLRAGDYGRCERCGKPIAPERLDALPAARTCMDCASHKR